jgi:hypothetical protein
MIEKLALSHTLNNDPHYTPTLHELKSGTFGMAEKINEIINVVNSIVEDRHLDPIAEDGMKKYKAIHQPDMRKIIHGQHVRGEDGGYANQLIVCDDGTAWMRVYDNSWREWHQIIPPNGVETKGFAQQHHQAQDVTREMPSFNESLVRELGYLNGFYHQFYKTLKRIHHDIGPGEVTDALSDAFSIILKRIAEIKGILPPEKF